MDVTTAAAKVAYQHSIDYLKKRNKADEGEDFTELQLKHFCICLSSFHAITVHLKCNDFHLKYKPCISASCPLGSGGRKWRTHHRLGFFGKPIICTKKSPEPFHSVISHCNRCSDIFHRAVTKYVTYCTKYLPSVTTYELNETYQAPDPFKSLRPACLDGDDEFEPDYEGSDNDYDTSDTQPSTEGSNEHDPSSEAVVTHVANNESVCPMDVDAEDSGVHNTDIEHVASKESEKPADFVTTHDSHSMAHQSPITETSSVVDVTEDVKMSEKTNKCGHLQKYPRQSGVRSAGNHENYSSSNGWEQSNEQSTNGWGETIKKYEPWSVPKKTSARTGIVRINNSHGFHTKPRHVDRFNQHSKKYGGMEVGDC